MGSTMMTTDRAGFPREIERLARRLGDLDARMTVTLKGGTVSIYVETGAGVELPPDPGPSPAEVAAADARAEVLAEREERARVERERDDARSAHDAAVANLGVATRVLAERDEQIRADFAARAAEGPRPGRQP